MTEDQLRRVLGSPHVSVGYTSPAFCADTIQRIVSHFQLHGAFTASPDLRKTRAEAEAAVISASPSAIQSAIVAIILNALERAGFFAAPALADGPYRCKYHHPTIDTFLVRKSGCWHWSDGDLVSDQSAVRPICRLEERPL